MKLNRDHAEDGGEAAIVSEKVEAGSRDLSVNEVPGSTNLLGDAALNEAVLIEIMKVRRERRFFPIPLLDVDTAGEVL